MKFHREISIATKIDSLETCRRLLNMKGYLLYMWRQIECKKFKKGDTVLYLRRGRRAKPSITTITRVNKVTIVLDQKLPMFYQGYMGKCDPDDVIKVTDKNRKLLMPLRKETCTRNWIISLLKEAHLLEGGVASSI